MCRTNGVLCSRAPEKGVEPPIKGRLSASGGRCGDP